MMIANDQRVEMYKIVPTDHENLSEVSQALTERLSSHYG